MLVVDRAGWIQANAEGFAQLLAPMIEKVAEKKGRPAGRPGRRLPDHRRRGRRAARLPRPARCSASSTRSTSRTAGCCWSRPTSSTSSASSSADPTRLPALGVPARGDPPRAVHRGAVDARPPLRRDHAARRDRRAGAAPRGAGSSGSPRRSRSGRSGSLLDLFSTPGAEGDPRPRHRRDVAARGPRRRRDGRRRSRGHPERRARSAPKFTQRRKGVGALDRLLRRLLGLEAKMAQYRDGAVVRPRASSTRSAWTTSTPSGPAADNLPSKAEISDPDAWVARVLREHAMTLHPVGRGRPDTPYARRSPDLEPGAAAVLVACSGGADSLALASRRGLRGTQARPASSSA